MDIKARPNDVLNQCNLTLQKRPLTQPSFAQMQYLSQGSYIHDVDKDGTVY